MKKIAYALSAVLFAFVLHSCNDSAKSDPKEVADSTNKARVERADSMGTPAVAAAPEDAEFAVKAADAGMTEVDLGMLAEGKATDAAVKEFASTMVRDHSKANTELKALAQKKNIALPAGASEDNQKAKQKLSEQKAGKDFDKAYVNMMVDDHKKAVKLFEDARDKVKDQDILAFINNTLPTLKAHLDHAQTLDKKKY